MAQEQFAGPEYFTEFDPEKFIRDMKIQAEEAEKGQNQSKNGDKDVAAAEMDAEGPQPEK
ncbi:hypothetical protein [Corynebacterium cystitidis]|uniref:Uncharacterized protein n=1 Tax=Corynebacterium cystitidis DSM 20524 TaxID=1121357 RepID=A0A1H9VPY9_9CORY|nr:hypothetical protein [Corynebacterium cystitidis]WJY82855.1 hypothetical protein CCYS_09705 [Corynebacterium cystitidis DSM 20524]SES23639.1 hypothetical protein SAMN05661109_02348 [Corynebacterium cystitidis DSM 20524]SNV69756.1 Uncharacterised protein [Corynebacterium cystitidis]